MHGVAVQIDLKIGEKCIFVPVTIRLKSMLPIGLRAEHYVNSLKILGLLASVCSTAGCSGRLLLLVFKLPGNDTLDHDHYKGVRT